MYVYSTQSIFVKILKYKYNGNIHKRDLQQTRVY